MNDLISRQAVIDLLKKSASRDIEEVVITEKHINLIKDMPCAYSVESVVEGLEDIKGKANGCFGIMCSECKYTKECHQGEKDFRVAIDNAISVVKRGGVE